jgi:glycosyltransferase involved in cell wall biosynthesis
MRLLAWALGKLQQRPFALLEWDIYPQILSPMGLAGRRNPLYQLWYQGHGAALRSARRIVTISNGMAAALQAMAKETLLQMDVIPNWVDTDWIRPRARADNAFAMEQGFGDKLVVMYSGNLGATHALETVVETAVLLRDEPDICFVCIGEGSKRPLIEEAIASGKAPTLRLLDRQPVERLPETLASADIGIVTLAEGYESLSMPSKTYGVLAAGSALLGISHQPNDLQCLIETAVCGANFAPSEAAEIADWLRRMNRERASLRQMQERARETAISQFSQDQCQKALTAVIQQWLADDQ